MVKPSSSHCVISKIFFFIKLGQKTSETTQDEAEKGVIMSASSEDSDNDLFDKKDDDDKSNMSNSSLNENNDSD